MTRRLVPAVLVAVAAVVLGGCAAPAPTGSAPASISDSATAAAASSNPSEYWLAYPPLADPSVRTTTTARVIQNPSDMAAADATLAPGVVPDNVLAAPPSAIRPEGPITSVRSAPAAVPEQLQFTATTLDGEPFNGADLAGKPAVLWFWAPWCPNCRAEAPQVAAAAAENPDVTFIGVAAQDALPAMQSFVTDYGVGGFQHLADLDAAIWQRFGVTLQPAYAFISADGSIDVVKSRVSAAQLENRLTQLSG